MIIDKQINFHNPHGFTCRCKCDICGKLFYRKAHWAERTKHQFCSQPCTRLYKSQEVTGDGNGRWIGGKQERWDGYFYIYDIESKNVNKYTMEHRLVMEHFLGRKLKDTEIVHHKNRNRQDNKIENLQLFETQRDHIQWYFLFRRITILLYLSIFKFNISLIFDNI